MHEIQISTAIGAEGLHGHIRSITCVHAAAHLFLIVITSLFATSGVVCDKHSKYGCCSSWQPITVSARGATAFPAHPLAMHALRNTNVAPSRVHVWCD